MKAKAILPLENHLLITKIVGVKKSNTFCISLRFLVLSGVVAPTDNENNIIVENLVNC